MHLCYVIFYTYTDFLKKNKVVIIRMPVMMYIIINNELDVIYPMNNK